MSVFFGNLVVAFCAMFAWFGQKEASENLHETKAEIFAITQALASDAMEGRGWGTKGHEKAVLYLEKWLSDHAFQPLGKKSGSFRHRSSKGTNLLGVIYPEGQEKENPTVLFSAHFDHLASGCGTDSKANSPVCNGASDNATGVATALVAALQIKDRIGSPVAVALWDREEEGLVGSTAFVRKPTFHLKHLKLVINLDIIGLNLFQGMESEHLVIGAETGGASLREHVTLVAQKSGLQIYPLTYAFGHQRSDHTSFVLSPAGGTPSIFFTDGDGAQYHSCRDEIGVVNFAKVSQVSAMVAELAVLASQPETSYTFAAPPRQATQFLPQFEDTVVLLNIFKKVLATSENNRLNSDQLDMIQNNRKWLHRMNRAGVNKFGPQEAQFLGGAIQNLTRISREVFAKTP